MDSTQSNTQYGKLDIRILRGRNLPVPDSEQIYCSVTVGLATEELVLSEGESVLNRIGGEYDVSYEEDDEVIEDDGKYLRWRNVLLIQIDLVSTYVLVRVYTKDNGVEVDVGCAWCPIAGLIKGKRHKSWWPVGEGEIQMSLLAIDFDKPIEILDSRLIVDRPIDSPTYQNVNNNVNNYQHSPEPSAPVYIPHRREVAQYDSRFATLEETNLISFRGNDIHREYPHLARGSYGVVFKGTVDSIPGQTVVIKDLEIQNQNTIPEWKKELKVMAKNRSPYIAEVYGYSMAQNMLTIVMEYMDKGSLYDFLHKQKYNISFVQRMRMARHCALGLSVLHSNNIIHRDIKSMNILVNSSLACKITDFGTAKFVSSSAHIINTVNSGTPLWMAPEVRMGQYTFSADIYSLGLVLYEIFENKLPVFDQVYQCVRLPHTFESASLVSPCLDLTPQRRPKANEVVIALDATIRNLVSNLIPKLSEEEKIKFNTHTTDPAQIEICLAEIYRDLLKRDPSEVDALIGVQTPTPEAPPLNSQPIIQQQYQAQQNYGYPPMGMNPQYGYHQQNMVFQQQPMMGYQQPYY